MCLPPFILPLPHGLVSSQLKTHRWASTHIERAPKEGIQLWLGEQKKGLTEPREGWKSSISKNIFTFEPQYPDNHCTVVTVQCQWWKWRRQASKILREMNHLLELVLRGCGISPSHFSSLVLPPLGRVYRCRCGKAVAEQENKSSRFLVG